MDVASMPRNYVPFLPKRHGARLPVTLNVRIFGIDARGKAFHQAATTVDVSHSGARVTGLTAQLNPGDIVGLQSSGEKRRFKVSWTSSNRDGTFQIGLHCIEKGSSPWKDRMQQVTPRDRRGNDRYPCCGSVSLHTSAFATPIWGTLLDISAGGCYVQCVNVAAVGDVVSGKFVLNGVQINGLAEVRSSRATVGMGLQWCDLGRDGQEKLNNVLRALSMNCNEANSNKMKALAKLEKLHQLVAVLRERLEDNNTLVNVQMLGGMNDAQGRLASALKSVQP
jgi:hypothetical protein